MNDFDFKNKYISMIDFDFKNKYILIQQIHIKHWHNRGTINKAMNN